MGQGAKIIENIVKQYPELKYRSSHLKYTRTTRNYSSSGGGGSSYRKDPTAEAALRDMSKYQKKEIAAVEFAIKQSYRYDDGLDRVRAILLLYWKEPMSVEDVAEEMNISIYDLNMYRDDFFYAVAQRLELTPCAGCVFWREYLPGYKGCHYTYDMGHRRLMAIDRSCLSKSTELETLEEAWWWHNDSISSLKLERRLAREQEERAASL